jgi:hypothetical protein
MAMNAGRDWDATSYPQAPTGRSYCIRKTGAPLLEKLHRAGHLSLLAFFGFNRFDVDPIGKIFQQVAATAACAWRRKPL